MEQKAVKKPSLLTTNESLNDFDDLDSSPISSFRPAKMLLGDNNNIVNWIVKNYEFFINCLNCLQGDTQAQCSAYKLPIAIIADFQHSLFKAYQKDAAYSKDSIANIITEFHQYTGYYTGEFDKRELYSFFEHHPAIATCLNAALKKLECVIPSWQSNKDNKKVKRVVGWLELHQAFFAASFTGELSSWITNTVTDLKSTNLNKHTEFKKQCEDLAIVSQKLKEILTASVDVRKSDPNSQFPDAMACFIDGIVGLDGEQRNEQVLSNNNSYLLETFLFVNSKVTDFLDKNTAIMEPIITMWQQANNKATSEQVGTQAVTETVANPNPLALYNSMRNIINSRNHGNSLAKSEKLNKRKTMGSDQEETEKQTKSHKTAPSEESVNTISGLVK